MRRGANGAGQRRSKTGPGVCRTYPFPLARTPTHKEPYEPLAASQAIHVSVVRNDLRPRQGLFPSVVQMFCQARAGHYATRFCANLPDASLPHAIRRHLSSLIQEGGRRGIEGAVRGNTGADHFDFGS